MAEGPPLCLGAGPLLRHGTYYVPSVKLCVQAALETYTPPLITV